MTLNTFMRGVILALLAGSLCVSTYGYATGSITTPELIGCFVSAMAGGFLALILPSED